MRIDKNVCLTMKEILFPVIYLVVNIFVATIVLVFYKGEEYGIIRTANTMKKYIYCKITIYFYVDLTLVLVLSVICSIQSFMARKLPTNYNESYYIFFAMFTKTILLLLSIPLYASYSKDGQQMLVNSCMIYAANISLVTIAYGYKIYIMIFQAISIQKKLSKKIWWKLLRKNLKSKLTSLVLNLFPGNGLQ